MIFLKGGGGVWLKGGLGLISGQVLLMPCPLVNMRGGPGVGEGVEYRRYQFTETKINQRKI